MTDQPTHNWPHRPLTGWGRTAPSTAAVATPVDDAGVQAILRHDAVGRGVLGRGLGRSYGDGALNAGGTVIDANGLSGVTAWDPTTGVVTARAGTNLDQLMRWFVPQGWFVPVTPGTRYVTVAGAVAADIHGKNHHRKGSWGQHVCSLRLVDGTGEVRELTPEGTPEEFWATVGGMGLTGVILDVTFRMTPIASSRIRVDTDRTDNLEDVLGLMLEGDDDYDYSVAWIDLVTRGASMGRSILTRGWFATADELPRRFRSEPLAYSTDVHVIAPPVFPSGLLNRATVRAFNEAWYRKAPRSRRDEIQSIPTFFHPLDMVGEWSRIYGPRGFLQWQFVVPTGEEAVMRRIIERLGQEGVASFLAVLKRFGPGSPGHLSFPSEGWTLALDIPAGLPGLSRTLDEMDEWVVAAGGRIYLAKDSRLRPDLVPRMYPRLEEWRAIRKRMDPDGRINSDLARRLNLR